MLWWPCRIIFPVKRQCSECSGYKCLRGILPAWLCSLWVGQSGNAVCCIQPLAIRSWHTVNVSLCLPSEEAEWPNQSCRLVRSRGRTDGKPPFSTFNGFHSSTTCYLTSVSSVFHGCISVLFLLPANTNIFLSLFLFFPPLRALGALCFFLLSISAVRYNTAISRFNCSVCFTSKSDLTR